MRKSKRTLTLVSLVSLLAVISAVVLKLFFINYSIVPQNGMYPQIPAGTLVFSWRHPYKTVSDVRRGDVVLFTRTESGQQYTFIWRVIGLPGDKVEINGETVLINGKPLIREQVRQDGNLTIYRESSGDAIYEVAYPKNSNVADQPNAALTVPENHLYLLGDNRFDARDSRYTGPVPFGSVIGKKM